MKKLAILNQVKRLWAHLLPKRKKQLLVLGVLMVVVSLLEVLGIGTALPFLGVLIAPDKVFSTAFLQPLFEALGFLSPQEIILPLTIIFILASTLAGLARVLLLWTQTRLSSNIGVDLTVRLYERTLYQPYILHTSRNSSEILAGIQKTNDLVGSMIQPAMIILSSIMILVTVTLSLLTVSPVVAVIALGSFALAYSTITLFTKRKISINTHLISKHQIRVTKTIQEGLGGIRDILLDSSQSVYLKQYRDTLIPMQKAIATNQVVSVTPRYAIEAIGISLIAGAAFVLSVGNSEGVSGVVPLLGVMALGAQRLLPMVQQIYSGYITIKGQQASIEDALSLLDQPTRNSAHPRVIKPLPFRRTLALRDLSFRYARDFPFILKSLNLEIMKGTRVGLIGTTGSGKSTLLDVVSGLLTPSQGSLLIDGVQVTNVNTQAWQQQIAHVPQGVFLADSSILENIAFGVPLGEIDIERVKQAAQKAQIAQTINNLSDGYSTMVGERGIRLSGGQRQRIGIARALYKRANVIILDEATSALDNETEEAVIQALESLGRNITIFFIAHRLTTLKNCDRILELDRGNITDLGTYNQMMTKFAQTL